MPIRRVFLDWTRPALVAAIEYLTHKYRREGLWDLGQVVVVVPGARAGRRLRELLVASSERSQCVLFPPDITTVGQLPERLYRRKRPFASQLVQKLAWSSALQSASPDCLSRFLSRLPPPDDPTRWFEIGALLWQQHRELASDGLSFQDVVMAGHATTGEADRWRALAEVQASYLAMLDAHGLWDRQTARLYAIEQRECQTDRDLVLLGTVDMNQALRAMLDQVQDRVTALVHAPRDASARFDAHGCLLPDRWLQAEIPLADRQLIQVDSPVDQGRAVVHHIAEFDGRYAADEIVVGVPDESLVPHIQQQLEQAGLPTRWGPGRSVEASRPIRLLRVVVDYLQRGGFPQLAELVRHPDVEDWLRGQPGVGAGLLDDLDDYHAEHLPAKTSVPATAGDRCAAHVGRLVPALNILLGDLLDDAREVAVWPERVLGFLDRIYGARSFDPQQDHDRMILDACESVRDALLTLEQIPASLLSRVTGAQAILMAIVSIESHQIPSAGSADDIQLLGWLELPLDDAPALIVTCLNEGTVPTAANSDLFLPDSLRARLGLGDNARRYARDAYALTVLIHSRRDLQLIIGRRDWQGNPLSPSRLLFAADTDTLVARSRRFFGETAEDGDLIGLQSNHPQTDRHQFVVPRPQVGREVTSLSVTDFRSYLQCPYRFYLDRVLRLKSREDSAEELDGAMFGSLAHRVLDRFGAGALRESTDPLEIENQLREYLAEVVEQRFGFKPRVAVQVQIAQLELRLIAFAAQQAKWRADGWQIVHTEKDLSTVWGPDPMRIQLRGRIDRVDWHEAKGRWAVLDYKTSDQVRKPQQTHLNSGCRTAQCEQDWADLQLPLYRHLARSIGCEGPVDLGYVLLPRETGRTGFYLAEWSDAELELADRAAEWVAREICAGRFWPPAERPPAFSERFSAICQDEVFERQLDEAVAEPAAGGTNR